MRVKPEILKTEVIASSRLFQVEQLELRFANGQQRSYERLRNKGHGAVMAIPLLDDNTVLLVREYAAGLHGYELGLPKGLIEAGETSLQAANRELMEEIGFAAHDLRLLTSMSAAPGYLSSRMDIVLAQNLYAAKLPGDEPEEIEIVPWKLSRIKELLQRDDFSEARSIAALFMVRELLCA
jgi:ADP-ribose diphosphatase